MEKVILVLLALLRTLANRYARLWGVWGLVATAAVVLVMPFAHFARLYIMEVVGVFPVAVAAFFAVLFLCEFWLFCRKKLIFNIIERGLERESARQWLGLHPHADRAPLDKLMPILEVMHETGVPTGDLQLVVDHHSQWVPSLQDRYRLYQIGLRPPKN